MPCFETGVGVITKYRRELFQWHFNLSKTNPITDTQGDLPDPDPAVVALEKRTRLSANSVQSDKTIFGEFNTGMYIGKCWLINHQITGRSPSTCFDFHFSFHFAGEPLSVGSIRSCFPKDARYSDQLARQPTSIMESNACYLR